MSNSSNTDEIDAILDNLDVNEVFDCPGGHNLDTYSRKEAHKAIEDLLIKARLEELLNIKDNLTQHIYQEPAYVSRIAELMKDLKG